MKHLFDYDAPLMRALRQIAYMILLNFVFVLTCMPVFTIGASAAALHEVLCSEFDENPAGKYFRLFKAHFAVATKCFLLLLLIGVVIFLDYCLSRSSASQSPSVFSYILLAAGFLLVMTAGYLFPLCAHSRKTSVRALYQQSIQYMLQYLPRSFLIGLLNILFPVLVLYFPFHLLRFGFVFLLIGFSFLAKMIVLLLRKPLRILAPEMQSGRKAAVEKQIISDSDEFYREFEKKSSRK